MGLGSAPKNFVSKPVLSFILETLGRIPEEDESFVFENLEFTAKTVTDGKLCEVIIHVLDEEDMLELQNSNKEKEGA